MAGEGRSLRPSSLLPPPSFPLSCAGTGRFVGRHGELWYSYLWGLTATGKRAAGAGRDLSLRVTRGKPGSG